MAGLPLDWVSLSSWTWGIADNKFVGIQNSYQDIVGLDIRTSPKSVTLSRAMVKDTWVIVTDRINCMLTTSVWDVMAFGSAGCIYISSSGTWQKVYTHATGYSIVGCAEYNWYVYRATLDKLSRTDLTSIATAIAWGTLTPTDLDRQTLNGITYTNGLETSYLLDTATLLKVGMKVYCKKNYNLTAVGVSDWTNAATKGYLLKYYEPAAIAGNSLRLYTCPDLDPTTGSAVWTERRPSGADSNFDWRVTNISRDWLGMIAWQFTGLLYTSADWGVNWTERYWATTTRLCSQDPYVSSSTIATSNGLTFTASKNCTLTKVSKPAACTATRCRLRLSSDWSVLATGSVTWDDATFSYALTWSTKYALEWDNSWSDYTNRYATLWAWWNWIISILQGSIDWVETNNIEHNVSEITTTDVWAAGEARDRTSSGMSHDGTKMIVCTNNANDWRIYISGDSGATWTETQPVTNVDKVRWFVAISWDGTKYLAWVDWARLYSSTDWVAWTEEQPDWASNYERHSWWINYDGTISLVCRGGAWEIYKSTDSFGTRVDQTSFSDDDRQKITASNDGMIIMATDNDNSSISVDWGATIDSKAGIMTTLKSNYLGNIITYGTSTRLYKTIDLRATASELQPAGDNSKSWKSISISPWAELLQTVDVTAGVATFSTSLTAWSYYYILFDKAGATRDPSYKVVSLPVTKTDINYISWIIPTIDTANARVITSIWATVVNDITHPMLNNNLYLYIGDWPYVHSVQWAVYDTATLTIPSKEFVYMLTVNGSTTRVYAKALMNDYGKCYYWDWVSLTVEQTQELTWDIKSVTTRESVDYMIMGDNPILYYYPFQKQNLKAINYHSSYPYNMTVRENYILFGRLWWVYSWWALNKNYADALNTDRQTSNLNLTDGITCIHNSNWTLYVAWDNASTYGIDKLSTTTYTTSWYFTCRVFYGTTAWKHKYGIEIYIVHKPLLTWETIQIYEQTDLTWGYTLKSTITWPTTANITKVKFNLKYTWVELKFIVNWPWTSTPEIFDVYFRWEEWQ